MLQMNAKKVLVQSIAASLLIASGSTVAATVTKQQVVEHYADVAHAVFAQLIARGQGPKDHLHVEITIGGGENVLQADILIHRNQLVPQAIVWRVQRYG